MKKLMFAVGILFTLGGVAIAGCLVLTSRVTANAHREFFDLVAAEDSAHFLSQADDRLIREVDGPVLETWMKELNQSLGNYQRTLVDGFRCDTRQDNQTRITEIAGTAIFDRGQATVELNYIDQKLAGFRIQSDQMASGWFNGPADTSLYQHRAKNFLQAMLNNQPLDAFTMMHEALQKQVTVDSLRVMGQKVVRVAGAIEHVNLVDEQFIDGEEGQRLTVRTEVVGKNQTMDARVVFQFIGMKGHLLEFGVTPRAAVDPKKVSTNP
jgi:hypothetical protein